MSCGLSAHMQPGWVSLALQVHSGGLMVPENSANQREFSTGQTAVFTGNAVGPCDRKGSRVRISMKEILTVPSKKHFVLPYLCYWTQPIYLYIKLFKSSVGRQHSILVKIQLHDGTTAMPSTVCIITFPGWQLLKYMII